MDDAQMTVINPTTITDAMYLSANVSENDYAEWLVGTTYNPGDYVMRAGLHKIYRCITTSNIGNPPETNTDVYFPSAPKWLEVGATNKWACFDTKGGSRTLATDKLEITFKPGTAGAMAFLSMIGGLLEVEVRNGIGGALVYSLSKSLVEPCSADWESYFFGEIEQIDDYVVLDGPRIPNAIITVRITGKGTVGIGSIIVGSKTELGTTQWNVVISSKDYSVKKTDEFGNTTIIPREVVKKMEGRAEVLDADVDRVNSKYNKLRSKPLVWIAANNLYRALIIYGFCESNSIDLSYTTHSICSFSIEGIV